MCNLVWCYVDMLVCFAWIVAQLLDQRPIFLAVVRHISVLNESLPRFPLFHCSTVSACASSSPAVMVSAEKGSCSYNWMYSLYCSARSVVSPGT